MTELFADNAQELRYRIFWLFLVLCIGSFFAFLFNTQITNWLDAPLRGTAGFILPQGSFGLTLSITLLGGFLVATPFVILNTILFLRPIIPQPISKGLLAKLFTISVAILMFGLVLAYYGLLPLVLAFLSGTIIHHLHPLISSETYLTFVMNFLAVVAVSLELPLLVLFLDRTMAINAELMENWRKWLFLTVFACAIVLPIAPDPISQIILAVPVVVCYQLTIWLLLLSHRANLKIPTPVPSGPQRLPLAIAVPHQSKPGSRQIVDPLRAPKSKTIDLRAKP
jgi:sec-independent protein translocase protein TatC